MYGIFSGEILAKSKNASINNSRKVLGSVKVPLTNIRLKEMKFFGVFPSLFLCCFIFNKFIAIEIFVINGTKVNHVKGGRRKIGSRFFASDFPVQLLSFCANECQYFTFSANCHSSG